MKAIKCAVLVLLLAALAATASGQGYATIYVYCDKPRWDTGLFINDSIVLDYSQNTPVEAYQENRSDQCRKISIDYAVLYVAPSASNLTFRAMRRNQHASTSCTTVSRPGYCTTWQYSQATWDNLSPEVSYPIEAGRTYYFKWSAPDVLSEGEKTKPKDLKLKLMSENDGAKVILKLGKKTKHEIGFYNHTWVRLNCPVFVNLSLK